MDARQVLEKSPLSDEAKSNIDIWLSRDDLADFRPELLKLIENEKWQELEDAFYTRIRVGTAGIRGNVGVGSNRINRRTIAEAAQGLVEFINGFGDEAKAKSVVVGHEARRQSRQFAELCCEVFAANGIKSSLFDGLRATPEISFAVRKLGATAGVMITASHNPRTDNGFKFYWSDGGQVVPPLDQKFMDLVSAVDQINQVPFDQALADGMVHIIGKEVDDTYIANIRGLSQNPSRSATIVFSPIHGAGITNVLPALVHEGFVVEVVKEQAKPDENFPTATGDLINPEFPEVMDRPIRLAEELSYDLALNSDPDADRLGVAAKVSLGSNTLQFLSGSEIAVALAHYLLSEYQAQGKLKPSHVIAMSNVTTNLVSDIAHHYGVVMHDDLLVGFKYVSKIIEELPNKSDFLLGAEETLGYVAGTFTREKDAAIASLLLAELVSKLKDQAKTLIDYFDDIYQEYGYYKNAVHMVELPGKQGFMNIGNIMVGFRTKPPTEFASLAVLEAQDRLPEDKRLGEAYKTGATGDQLTFFLSEDKRSKVTVRPSGTEPKVKLYIQLFAPVAGDLAQVKQSTDQKAAAVMQAVIAYTDGFIQK